MSGGSPTGPGARGGAGPAAVAGCIAGAGAGLGWACALPGLRGPGRPPSAQQHPLHPLPLQPVLAAAAASQPFAACVVAARVRLSPSISFAAGAPCCARRRWMARQRHTPSCCAALGTFSAGPRRVANLPSPTPLCFRPAGSAAGRGLLEGLFALLFLTGTLPAPPLLVPTCPLRAARTRLTRRPRSVQGHAPVAEDGPLTGRAFDRAHAAFDRACPCCLIARAMFDRARCI